MRVNTLFPTRMLTFAYDFDSIQKKNDDLSFDIEDPYWNPNKKNYKEGFTYHDAISGKYFRRDSNAPGGDGVPQGFVEVQINRYDLPWYTSTIDSQFTSQTQQPL